MDVMGLTVRTVRTVETVSRAKWANRARLVRKGPPVVRVKRVPKERPAPKALRANKVNKVSLANKVRRGCPAWTARRAPPGQQANLGETVHLAPRTNPAALPKTTTAPTPSIVRIACP